MNDVPEILIKAQEFQKAGDYSLSMNLYLQFFDENPTHELRFKALFEVADNYFHAKEYALAREGYERFLEYCVSQKSVTQKEQGWINAYSDLARSRIKQMTKG